MKFEAIFGKIKDNTLKYAHEAKDNILDLSEIGKDKISIKMLENKIEGFAKEIGIYAIDQFRNGSEKIENSDETVIAIMKNVEKLKHEISEKSQHIEEIKK